MNHTNKIIPLAYFITFTTYGTWMHGNKKEGSIDRKHNQFNTPRLSVNQTRNNIETKRMKHLPYLLDASRRKIVLESIKPACLYRKWDLLAAHVRSNHVHLVIHAPVVPEFVMNTIKAYSSRNLNQSYPNEKEIKRWTHHGSTKYLWEEAHVEATIHYVVHEQGNPMAVFENKERVLRIAI